MFVTADQLVLHLTADTLLQTEWMWLGKRKDWVAAGVHAATYTAAFVLLTTSWQALAFICAAHFAVDWWSLGRRLVWVKNGCRKSILPGPACGGKTAAVTSWQYAVVDAVLHVVCNAAAIALLG